MEVENESGPDPEVAALIGEDGHQQQVHPAEKQGSTRPDPEWVRGVCPECGDDLVSNLYYVGGKGYYIRWECWSSLKEKPTCNYRKVL